MFAVRLPPHFLNQAPPVAQQLSRLDLPKVPHFGHVVTIVVTDVMAWAIDVALVEVVDTAIILRT